MVSPQMTNMSLRRIVRDSAILVGLLLTAYLVFVAAPAKGVLFSDAYAYWKVDLAYPYAGQVGDLGFFPYSPPIALLFAPLGNLSWLAFLAVWYGLIFASLAWLARGSFLLFLSLLAFPPVALNLVDGNIHIFLAVVIALGFRYPALWSAVLLTKVTPGVALLWFAVRREWRSLMIALGVTAAIAGVTFVFMPTQWIDWVSMLLANSNTPPPWPALPIPLWLRLPVAVVVVVWGARTDRMWTVPLSAVIALPALWLGGLAMLAACWRLPSNVADYHAADAVRTSAWSRAVRSFRPGARTA